MDYRGLRLDRFQAEAIEHLQAGRSVLVAAPTGTGKTLVADWMVDQALESGRRVIYTAPIKALSNQKFRDYGRLHGEARVGLVTGDLVIRRDAPCLVMTTEILRNMLLADEPLDDLAAVVIDEVHFLDDRERGTVWEEVLIYLPEHVRIVALSATLPNLEDFSAWLTHVRGHPVEVVIETRRAVPLDYWFVSEGMGMLSPEEFHVRATQALRLQAAEPSEGRGDGGRGRGRGRGRGQGRGERDRGRPGARRSAPRTHPIDLFREVRKRGWLPMLYFVFSRHDAERFAKALAFRFHAELLDERQAAEVAAFLEAHDPGPALDDELRRMLLQGIAYHHAGLHVALKAIVEELYERKLLPCLFCTSTFALGINMPARTVGFHGLEKFDGQAVRPLPTRGFMQKAGRAGRRGMDEHGHVVVRMDPSEWPAMRPIFERYTRHAYEPVRSSFNLSWNSVIKLLENHDLDGIREIVDKSFLSWSLARHSHEQVAQAEALERRAGDREAGKRDLKEARRLRRRAEHAHEQCWQEFEDKRRFLQEVGYLGADDAFHAGAKVLRHLQIAEILVTELVLSGVLEDLDDHTLFGVLFSLTSDVPRSVQLGMRLDRHDRELATRIFELRQSGPVVGAEQITRLPVTWSPDLLPLGRAWARGAPLEALLAEISSSSDWSGSLVTGLRRAKDLLGQLVDVYADMPDRAASLRRLLREVSRDEVEVVD